MGVKEAGMGPPEEENSINDYNTDFRPQMKRGTK